MDKFTCFLNFFLETLIYLGYYKFQIFILGMRKNGILNIVNQWKLHFHMYSIQIHPMFYYSIKFICCKIDVLITYI